jgi:FMN phosphatase YigB (HAD superfamily)
MKPSKILLLDVDGVVMAHPQVLHHVTRKIVSYVRNHVPNRPMNMMEAAHINEVLYKNYGHTFRGMQHVYGAGNVPSLNHFQAAIYDTPTLEYLDAYKNDTVMHMRREDVLCLLDKAAKLDVPVYFFSNSPLEWCAAISDMLNLHLHSNQMLCHNHPVFQDSLLKPDGKLYQQVSTFLLQTHRDMGDDTQFVFVDDSWTNLMPVVGNDAWRPVFFAPLGPKITSGRVQTVYRLHDICI